jgi:hypothetical protein
VAHHWTETTQALWARVWAEIADTTTPRGGYGGLVTLATVSAAGAPELRQVVLRRSDPAVGMVEVFTDATTPKVAEIADNPRVALLIWHAEDQLQIRLRGSAEVITGERVLADWQAIGEAQRGNYGTKPSPGTPIAESGAFGRVPDPARLAILRITLTEIDAVHLARPHDIRACFARARNWQGHWVAP